MSSKDKVEVRQIWKEMASDRVATITKIFTKTSGTRWCSAIMKGDTFRNFYEEFGLLNSDGTNNWTNWELIGTDQDICIHDCCAKIIP